MELRLLHTADVHLNRAAPERLTALDAVCRLTRDYNCDALLISGDLFDGADAALDYKAQVQDLFIRSIKKSLLYRVTMMQRPSAMGFMELTFRLL